MDKQPVGFSIDFPRAYPDLGIVGQFRSCPEDFVVDEHLGFEPTGDGEHVLLHIEKIGQNTHWVGQQLAELFDFDPKAVGFCGRKDRHAVTRQWFSLYDPQRIVDDALINIEGVRLLKVTRHIRKLRPGDHTANHFCIRLRQIKYTDTQKVLTDSDLAKLLPIISERLTVGVPNYFGAQRFGRELSNLHAAHTWLIDGRKPPRQRKSMVMSAARSYLFNQVLAKRVLNQTWTKSMEGDVLIDDQPSAPLWGRGRSATSKEAQVLETEALKPLIEWANGLEHCGLKQERRALQLLAQTPEVISDHSDIVLSFGLPSGTFATAVLAEIAQLSDGD